MNLTEESIKVMRASKKRSLKRLYLTLQLFGRYGKTRWNELPKSLSTSEKLDFIIDDLEQTSSDLRAIKG